MKVRQWLLRRRFRLSWEGAAYLLLIALALGMRLWQLDGRAIHYDEALHIHYGYNFAEGRSYTHTPLMHGPFKFHMNALFFKIFGDSDYTARLPYALLGTALVALPFFFRGYLGRAGALMVSVMLALSPVMLYLSRFGRDDIFMAFWGVALVILMWRYLNEGRDRYLYGAAAVLALAYSTMETAWILTFVLGLFLLLVAIPDLMPWIIGRTRLSQFAPPAGFLVLLVTLTLPQFSALTGLIQDPLDIVLVTPQSAGGPVGLPQGTKGLYAALSVLAFTMAISAVTGIMWKGRRWLICAAIFYAIYITFYTSVYTNLGGFFTGIWQSLGYWMAQQEVARGGQPWYYYLVIGSAYEFLPLWLGPIAAIYFIRKGEMLGLFLVFWAFVTLLGYTIASEKMPWLLTHVALPFIVLTGAFLGQMIETVPWRRVLASVERVLVLPERAPTMGYLGPARPTVALVFTGAGGLLLLFVPALIALGIWLLKRYLDIGSLTSDLSWSLLGAVIFLILVVGLMLYRYRRAHAPAVALLGLAGLMLGFTFVTAARASYTYDDRPIEMLNYAAGSIQVRQVAREVQQVAAQHNPAAKVEVDYELWYPFQWYVRRESDKRMVEFRCYKERSEDGWVSWCNPITATPTATAVLLNVPHSRRDLTYLTDYQERGPYRNLLWFPEVYRVPDELRGDKVVTKLRKEFSYVKENVSRKAAWRGVVVYFLERKLGSQWWYSDFYAYLPKQSSDVATRQ